MNVPYDNGKVKMGIYYQKPAYVEEDSDMLLIQDSLIMSTKYLKFRYWQWKIYGALLFFVTLICILSTKS